MASCIEQLGYTVKRERLDVGDAMVCGETKIVIERKTWNDLLASICDGRFSEQKSRMVEPQTSYVIIIEGEIQNWHGGSNAIKNQCAWAAVIKTVMRDNIAIFHAANTASVAEIITYLYKQLKDDTLLQRKGCATPGVSKRKRENLSDPSKVLRAMVMTIPGLSANRADAILTEFPTVRALTDASIEEISNIKCNGRCIGRNLGNSIHAVFNFVKPNGEAR